jgi:hypothetical protein
MFIKYNPKDPHVKTIPVVMKSSGSEGVPLANDSVILRPGTNELTEKEWEAIKPHLQDEIKQKIIVPFTVDVRGKTGGIIKAHSLKEVPVSVARKIIASCQNVADLKKWMQQELPDEIMLLVLKRLRKFRIDPDEFAKDLSIEDDSLDEDITPEENTNIVQDTKADNTDPEGSEDPEEETGAGGETETTGDDEDLEDDDDEIPDFDGSGNGGGAE